MSPPIFPPLEIISDLPHPSSNKEVKKKFTKGGGGEGTR